MTLLRRLDPWFPPLALMALIFLLSAQPSLNSGLGLLDQVGRKLVHFAEFALLCILWWRALNGRLAPGRTLAAALLVTIAYAATDEYHQSFVDGRNGSPLDWVIDVAGAGGAALGVRGAARRAEQRA